MQDDLLEKAAKLFCEKTGDDPLAKIPATNDPAGPYTERWRLIAASIQFHSLIKQCIDQVIRENIQPMEVSESLAEAMDKLK